MFGKVLCIAGSVNMAGAAYLCAAAAYRSGAGLLARHLLEYLPQAMRLEI